MADVKISALPAATTPLAGTEVLPLVQSSTTKKVATDDLTVKNVRSNATTGILQIAGPATGTTRTMTAPNANFTVARTDAGQTFTGVQVMTSPNIVTSINDTNGNEVFGITATASAVNELTVANAATGNNPVISATGSDTDIGITVTPKGTGNLNLSAGNLVIGTAAKGANFTANTPAAGMTSQLLNWYEEGTWTPTDASGAGLTFTGTSGNCHYTRVGNIVTATVMVTFPATASASAVSIGGLPFTSKATTNAIASVSISYSDYGAGIYGRVANNATTFTLFPVTTVGTALTNANMSGKNFRGTIIYLV